MNETNNHFILNPIGQVHVTKEKFSIEIAKPYRAGLKELNHFSHVIVSWWATEQDNSQSRAIIETKLPYASNIVAGVFACRSEYRPNPIGITVCYCQNIDLEKGLIEVPYIDAFDKTPVIDLKPYFPVSDRVRDFKVPSWVENWPEWYEDAYKLQELFANMA